jgi:hypothetical protein
MTLNECVKLFLKSNNRNIQLDIFRINGEVLMQIFRKRDVKSWSWGIDYMDDDGCIIDLTFNKQKTNNEQNLKRFENSDFYKFFKIKPSRIGKSFYIDIAESWNNTDLENYIFQIISVIYDMNDRIEFTLNAYI